MGRLLVYKDSYMEGVESNIKKVYDLCYDSFSYDYSWDAIMIKEAWLLHVDNFSKNYKTHGLISLIENFDIEVFIKTDYDNTMRITNHFSDIEF
jgi:hypothetical protein